MAANVEFWPYFRQLRDKLRRDGAPLKSNLAK